MKDAKTPADLELSEWASEQRRLYCTGRLSPLKVKKLEAISGWSWEEVAAPPTEDQRLKKFRTKQRRIAQQIVDAINRHSPELPWIEEAYVNDSNHACWPNGGFLHDFGWSYLFTMYTPREAVVKAAIARCKDVGLEPGNDAEDFFGELFDVVNNLKDGFFIETYDNQEAVPQK